MSLFSPFGQDVWDIAGISFASPISDILEKDEFTLEELLSEEELLQEVKSGNSDLTAYLTQKDVIEKLIHYIVDPAVDNESDLRRFKYPYMSCEIFRCEIPDITTLASRVENLGLLFSFLDHATPLDSYLSGYFENLLEVLFKNATASIMLYLNENRVILMRKFIKHISSYSIMQLVQRLMLPHIPFSADYDNFESGKDIQNLQCNWSYYNEASELLIEIMLTDTEQDATLHISDLLITVIQLSPADAPILKNLCDIRILEKLSNSIKDFSSSPNSDCLLNWNASALCVFECLLSRLNESSVSLLYDGNIDEDNKELSKTVLLCIQNVTFFILDFLAGFPKECVLDHSGHSFESSFFVTSEGLSQRGYFFVKLVEALARLDDRKIDDCLCGYGTIAIIIDLFFKYEKHSMLHVSVQRLLVTIISNFNSRRKIFSSTIIDSLLVDRLMAKLTSAVDSSPAFRSPIIGHLVVVAQAIDIVINSQEKETEVSEHILECPAELDPLSSLEAIKTSIENIESPSIAIPSWNTFAETVLAKFTAQSSGGTASTGTDSQHQTVNSHEISIHSLTAASSSSQQPFPEELDSQSHMDFASFAVEWDSFPALDLTGSEIQINTSGAAGEGQSVEVQAFEVDWDSFSSAEFPDSSEIN